MSPIPAMPTSVLDFSAFSRMRVDAQHNSPEAARTAAKQFEGLMVQMVMKSMRATSFGDDLSGNSGGSYRDLYDQQMAQTLTSGKGLGLADTLVRQMTGQGAAVGMATAPTAAAATIPAVTSATRSATVADRADVPPGATALHGKQRFFAMPGSFTARHASAAAGGDVASASGQTMTAARMVMMAAQARQYPNAAQSEGQRPDAIDATPSPAAASAGRPLGRSAQAFTEALRPHAEKAAAELGVPARALIAQAALETGWGRHMPRHADGRMSYNLFGVKAHGNWRGDSVNIATQEYANGAMRRERADFRAYESVGKAFDDYVRFLKANPRYADALRAGKDDVGGFARGLQKAGYATDPAYAQKLMKVAYGKTLNSAWSRSSGGQSV